MSTTNPDKVSFLYFFANYQLQRLPEIKPNGLWFLNLNAQIVLPKGIKLNTTQYEKNLGLYTPDGKYNIMAQLLSDNSHIPVRVAIFSGKSKSDNMYSVREFGFQCLLYTLDEILRYGDVLNIIQADEVDRVVERKEVPLFDKDAFGVGIGVRNVGAPNHTRGFQHFITCKVEQRIVSGYHLVCCLQGLCIVAHI